MEGLDVTGFSGDFGFICQEQRAWHRNLAPVAAAWGFVLSHPFRKKRGMDGAPAFVVGSRVWHPPYCEWLALCCARIPAKMRNRKSACIVLLFAALTLSAQTPSVAVPKLLAQPSVPHFRDVSAEAGLRTLPHTNLDRRYVIETMSGGGVAFLDCNNNGNLDIAVVNDSSIDRYLAGGDPMITL